MKETFKRKLGGLCLALAGGFLSIQSTPAISQIYFQDAGPYVFTHPVSYSEGQTGGWSASWGARLDWIPLSSPIAGGTTVTLTARLSNLSMGSVRSNPTSLDFYAVKNDWGSVLGGASGPTLESIGNGIIRITGSPTGSAAFLSFGGLNSDTGFSATLSNICVFVGSFSCFGPSADDTLASMQRNAEALRNAFNLQSAKMAQGLSYDCSVFDAKNICVSFAGTRSDSKGGLDDTRGALIVAHKPNANVRFGGYIDQSFNSSESGGLKVKHSSPGYGVFAVWSEKADGSGLQVQGSASFGKADIESTRSEVGTAEAGFGKSDIKSDGFQVEASRDYAVNAMWSARPYVGFRQLTNRRASYAETDAVDFPLSYSSIKQSTQSLLAGVRFAHTISAQTTMTVAAGLEHDIKNDVDRYEATGVDDLGSIDMADGKKNTRPTLSLGLTHVIDKAQRIGVSITHRKEAFESGSTTAGMVQYSRGF